MDLSHILYFDALDPIVIALSLLVSGGLLARVVLDSGPLRAGDWTRIRFSVVLPLAITAVVSLFSEYSITVVRLLLHVGATVYPVLGLALAGIVYRRGTERRWPRALAYAFAALTLAAPPLVGWMIFVEPYYLEVTETQVVTDTPAREPLRVVVLADVQTDRFGEFEDDVARRVARLDPDLVVMPGDLLDVAPEHYREALPGALAFLEKLEARHGVFFVEGDHDLVVEHYRRGGVSVLDNEIAELDIGGRTVALAGTELNYTTEEAAEAIEALEDHPAELKLLLAHRPMTATVAPRENSEIDLVVAGHTHGGQISLPLLGPPITMSPIPRRIAAGGLHSLGGRALYVSRGIGMGRDVAPRVRLGARPEISLLLVR